MRDLKVSLNWLVSMANSPEREQCPDTIHETAIHNTERAIAAENKLERIAEYCMDGYENPELYYDGAFTQIDPILDIIGDHKATPTDKERAKKCESLARELVAALEMAFDLLEHHQPNWYTRAHFHQINNALGSYKEVLGDDKVHAGRQSTSAKNY
jgi:hypothetical protein